MRECRCVESMLPGDQQNDGRRQCRRSVPNDRWLVSLMTIDLAYGEPYATDFTAITRPRPLPHSTEPGIWLSARI